MSSKPRPLPTYTDYRRHTKTTKHKDGTFTIRCRKGLWSVRAADIEKAEFEAVNYFVQYFADGEYEG